MANVLGSGFTMNKTWEVAVDLKLQPNHEGQKYANVFMFTVTVKKRLEGGIEIKSKSYNLFSKYYLLWKTFQLQTIHERPTPT